MKLIHSLLASLSLLLAFAGAQLFADPPPSNASLPPTPAEEVSPAGANTKETLAKTPPSANPGAVVEPEEPKPTPELRDLTAPAVEDRSAPRVEVDVEQDRKNPRPSRPSRSFRRGHVSVNGERDVVSFGDAVGVPEETAEAVVAIFGNAEANGPVKEAVVAVFGNSVAREDVGEAVVAVMGDATADKSVGENVVAVMGDVHVGGHVHQEVVAVLGDVWLGPEAEVTGNVVSVGGRVIRDPSAIVHGRINEIPFLRHIPMLGTVGAWFQQAILKGRLLALHQHLVWPWGLAFSFLGFYLLLALGFGPTLTRCAETLEQRPLKTMFAALLALVVAPALMAVLLVTVIGAAAVFFAVVAALLVGKASFLAWIGRRFAKPLGTSNVAVAVLVGGLLVVVLYTLPVIGLLVWAMGSALGLGMAVYTVILTSGRDRAARTLPPESPPSSISGPSAAAAPVISTPTLMASVSGPIPPPPVPPPVPTTGAGGTRPPLPVLPSSFVGLPRAGFWIRIAASLLDAILVAIAAGVLHLGDLFILLLTAYSIVMWAKKGTTVGGIICGLKVVRIDDRPLDWSVSVVRALGAFLSLCVAGLGFIWVAFDDDRQSWHDKISGTTIVRVPKGVSLV